MGNDDALKILMGARAGLALVGFSGMLGTVASKRYTPSLERVWEEWHRRERFRKWQAERAARGIKPGPPTPPNSEPWLPHPPRSLDDLFYISDRVRETAEAWKLAFKLSSDR